MKASWKGSIEVGMLTIPEVNMYSAIEAGEKVSFNQLHKECCNPVEGAFTRLQQKMFCPTCDKAILDKTAEIIKGYEIEKGKFVTLSQGEIDSCKKESTERIKVVQFVNDGEIPEIYFESSYFLSAVKTGIPTFGLLYQILTTLNKVALAKVVMRAKDHFMAIKPYNGLLMAYDLYFPAEIRATDEVANPKFVEAQFDNETMDLAKRLVLKMTKPFRPDEIKDEYTAQIRQIIQAKAEGKPVYVEEIREERTAVSLKDALMGSLSEASLSEAA